MTQSFSNTSTLHAKLPSVRGWIEATVQQHRHIARPVTSLRFARLPRYFKLETLNRAFVVVVDAVPMPPLAILGLAQFQAFEDMDADGITYNDTYFVKRERAVDESLHFHELVHVVQWQLLGPEQFILSYASALASDGYSDNPFEQIAYALEDRFSQHDVPFEVEPAVKRHLAQIVPTGLLHQSFTG